LTTTSPLSQCRPTTRDSIGAADEARDASTTVYSASYRAVRMLSLIPPSTETNVRWPATTFTVPTS